MMALDLLWFRHYNTVTCHVNMQSWLSSCGRNPLRRRCCCCWCCCCCCCCCCCRCCCCHCSHCSLLLLLSVTFATAPLQAFCSLTSKPDVHRPLPFPKPSVNHHIEKDMLLRAHPTPASSNKGNYRILQQPRQPQQPPTTLAMTVIATNINAKTTNKNSTHSNTYSWYLQARFGLPMAIVKDLKPHAVLAHTNGDCHWAVRLVHGCAPHQQQQATLQP